MRRILSTAIALVWLVVGILGAETISVERPAIHPDTAENRSVVDSILGRAAVLADRQYGDLFSVEYEGSVGDYTIESVIAFSEGEPVGSLSISRTGSATEHSFPILGEFTEDKVSYYAAGIASMWNAFTAGFEKSLRNPPRYVDEMPTEIITPLIVPTNPALAPSLSPMSGAALSDGSLVIGMNLAAAVIDPWFRLVGRPGGDQVEKNNYNLAARVFTTPADTVYLIPPSGRAFYRVVDGVPGSLRSQIGNDVSCYTDRCIARRQRHSEEHLDKRGGEIRWPRAIQVLSRDRQLLTRVTYRHRTRRKPLGLGSSRAQSKDLLSQRRAPRFGGCDTRCRQFPITAGADPVPGWEFPTPRCLRDGTRAQEIQEGRTA